MCSFVLEFSLVLLHAVNKPPKRKTTISHLSYTIPNPEHSTRRFFVHVVLCAEESGSYYWTKFPTALAWVRWPSWLWRQVKVNLNTNFLVEQSSWVRVPVSSKISFFADSYSTFWRLLVLVYVFLLATLNHCWGWPWSSRWRIKYGTMIGAWYPTNFDSW